MALITFERPVVDDYAIDKRLEWAYGKDDLYRTIGHDCHLKFQIYRNGSYIYSFVVSIEGLPIGLLLLHVLFIN